MVHAEARVEALIEHWNTLADDQWVKIPDIGFYQRGRSAGQASRDGDLVRFHLGLLATHWQAYEDEVFAHETAHSICFQLHGSRVRPHGPEWRSIGQRLGYQLEVTHHLPTDTLKARRTRYIELQTESGSALWIPVARWTRAKRRGALLYEKTTHERLYPTGRERME